MATRKSNSAVTITRVFWKSGSSDFRNHDAAEIHEELEKIRIRRGTLDKSIVVDESRNKKSPIHPIIWSASEADAARMGREAIAAKLLRSIQIRIIQPDRTEVDVRAFTCRPVEGAGQKRAYVATLAEMNTEEGRAVLLRQAWIELRAFKRKYQSLSELAKVLDAIELTLSRSA